MVRPKRLKNHSLWDRTWLYNLYKGVSLLPGIDLEIFKETFYKELRLEQNCMIPWPVYFQELYGLLTACYPVNCWSVKQPATYHMSVEREMVSKLTASGAETKKRSFINKCLLDRL